MRGFRGGNNSHCASCFGSGDELVASASVTCLIVSHGDPAKSQGHLFHPGMNNLLKDWFLLTGCMEMCQCGLFMLYCASIERAVSSEHVGEGKSDLLS